MGKKILELFLSPYYWTTLYVKNVVLGKKYAHVHITLVIFKNSSLNSTFCNKTYGMMTNEA